MYTQRVFSAVTLDLASVCGWVVLARAESKSSRNKPELNPLIDPANGWADSDSELAQFRLSSALRVGFPGKDHGALVHRFRPNRSAPITRVCQNRSHRIRAQSHHRFNLPLGLKISSFFLHLPLSPKVITQERWRLYRNKQLMLSWSGT